MRIAFYYMRVLKQEFQMLPQLIELIFSSKKKAIYIGCTGMGNLGDEVVYDAINNILDDICLYKILYSSPKAGKIGRKIFVKKVDYLILGGGTIIKKDANSGYLKILKDIRANYPAAKMVVFGAGVADPELAKKVGFPTNVSDWSELLNKCNFIAVRGNLSQQLLKSKEWSIYKDVHVLHDPAIYYAKDKLTIKPKSKKIGLNFCNIAGRIYGQNPKQLEQFANDLIAKLLANSWEIILYPTVDTDINYMLTTIEEKLLNQVTVFRNVTNSKKSLSFFDSIDVFVGQRLHSIIFSSITYTPFHAIEYESKTTDFLISLGLNDYSTRTDNLDVNLVLERINYIYSHIDEEQSKLFELCQNAKNEQKYISSLLK
jgi:polysaccharide pyruvyl transferase WcaK-like protein